MPPGGRGMGGPMGRYLTEEEKQNRPKITPALLKRIFSYLWVYRFRLAVSLLCIIVSSFFTLLPSILTCRIIDEGLIKADLRALVYYILLSLSVTCLANLIGMLESYLSTWIAQHITSAMRNQLYSPM